MIEKYLEYEPQLGRDVYVAPTALVLGRVTLGDRASVWPGVVLRGDINEIIVGEHTNIQDLCVGHLEDDLPLVVGAYVTVGHGAILHACEVGDGCLVGMGAYLGLLWAIAAGVASLALRDGGSGSSRRCWFRLSSCSGSPPTASPGPASRRRSSIGHG